MKKILFNLEHTRSLSTLLLVSAFCCCFTFGTTDTFAQGCVDEGILTTYYCECNPNTGCNEGGSPDTHAGVFLCVSDNTSVPASDGYGCDGSDTCNVQIAASSFISVMRPVAVRLFGKSKSQLPKM